MGEIIQLRGGQTTLDPRLDRLKEWDPKNEDYPIRTLLAPAEASEPRSYTWSMPTVLDQGSEGSCVGHGWAHELLARPAKSPAFVDHSYAKEKIYWEAQRIDSWEGGSYPSASPFYEGTSVLAGAKVCKDKGWFTEYRWAFTLDEVIAAIGYKGPIVVGVNWYDGMFNVDQKGFVRVTGRIAGGHCVLWNKVNIKEEYIGFPNSWGIRWGINGYGRISFADAERLIQEDGDMCIPVGRKVLQAA